MAPPKSSLYVLEGIRNLKQKLQQDPNAQGRIQENNNVMDMLIDLDIKSEPAQTNNGSTPGGIDDLLDMGTSYTPNP